MSGVMLQDRSQDVRLPALISFLQPLTSGVASQPRWRGSLLKHTELNFVEQDDKNIKDDIMSVKTIYFYLNGNLFIYYDFDLESTI